MRTMAFGAALMGMTWMAGCGGASRSEDSSVGQEIVNGTAAQAYKEAALIDMGDFACSGAVIAPQVVLTAGHCVVGVDSFDVRTPYASNQSAKATASEVYDFKDSGDFVDGRYHDIALIYLNTRIELDRYPKIASTKLPDGATLINIGRIRNGVMAHHNLYLSRPLQVFDAADEDFPNGYRSKEVIESGDSGGPCVIPDSADHEIAAVNSASGQGEQELARTDLLHSWILRKIAAHGGGGFEGSNNGNGNDRCSPEIEPNDSGTAGTPLDDDATDACGALGAGGDQDWFTFSVNEAGVAYAVDLEATGDAKLTVQKQLATGWKTLQTDGKRVANTSTSASAYRIGVQSASGAAQTYKLHLHRSGVADTDHGPQ